MNFYGLQLLVWSAAIAAMIWLSSDGQGFLHGLHKASERVSMFSQGGEN